MRAVVTQKVSSVETTYGQKVGGKTGSSTPGNIETSFFENVTSVVETIADGVPVYSIIHTTNESAEPHTTNYAIADYIIVIGG